MQNNDYIKIGGAKIPYSSFEKFTFFSQLKSFTPATMRKVANLYLSHCKQSITPGYVRKIATSEPTAYGVFSLWIGPRFKSGPAFYIVLEDGRVFKEADRFSLSCRIRRNSSNNTLIEELGKGNFSLLGILVWKPNESTIYTSRYNIPHNASGFDYNKDVKAFNSVVTNIEAKGSGNSISYASKISVGVSLATYGGGGQMYYSYDLAVLVANAIGKLLNSIGKDEAKQFSISFAGQNTWERRRYITISYKGKSIDVEMTPGDITHFGEDMRLWSVSVNKAPVKPIRGYGKRSFGDYSLDLENFNSYVDTIYFMCADAFGLQAA